MFEFEFSTATLWDVLKHWEAEKKLEPRLSSSTIPVCLNFNKSLSVEVIEKPAPIVVTIDDDEIIVDGPVPAVHEESEETVKKPKVSCNKFKSGYINDSKKNETSLACTFSF